MDNLVFEREVDLFHPPAIEEAEKIIRDLDLHIDDEHLSIDHFCANYNIEGEAYTTIRDYVIKSRKIKQQCDSKIEEHIMETVGMRLMARAALSSHVGLLIGMACGVANALYQQEPDKVESYATSGLLIGSFGGTILEFLLGPFNRYVQELQAAPIREIYHKQWQDTRQETISRLEQQITEYNKR